MALYLSILFPGAGQLMYGQTTVGIVLLLATILTLFIGWFVTMPISVAMTALAAFEPRLTPR